MTDSVKQAPQPLRIPKDKEIRGDVLADEMQSALSEFENVSVVLMADGDLQITGTHKADPARLVGAAERTAVQRVLRDHKNDDPPADAIRSRAGDALNDAAEWARIPERDRWETVRLMLGGKA